MSGDTPNFEEWAREAGVRQRGVCSICLLPDDVKAEIHKAWGMGARAKNIRLYLEYVGHGNATEPRLNHHFYGRHHEVS